MKEHYSQTYSIDDLINKYCSDEWKARIDEKKEVFKFSQGDRIFSEGSVCTHIKILKTGKAKIHSEIENKKEQIVRLVSNKQILGHRAFGGNFKYSVSATALTDCTVEFIPLNLFLDVLKSNNEFCFYFMMFFAEELKKSERQIKLNGAKNLDKRVATAILDNLSAFGYDKKDKKMLAYTVPRKDYASMANTTYESIIRTFKHFSDIKVLNLKGKKIEIINEKKLIEISTVNN